MKLVTLLEFALAVLALASQIAPVRAQTKPAAGHVDFDRQVRPILSDKCFKCHGPDAESRMAKLRFDTKEGGAFSDRGGYRVIVPGDSANSRMYQRISSAKKSFRMPPVSSGLSLTGEQVDLIRKWIDQGANWETHWAYVAPKRPPLPEVSNKAWVRNPIDDFVLARLDKEGLKPAPEADKTTLLRRVTFDLTGLPPTPQEVDAFLADKSSDAYKKVVDRLLHSPRYGERMAMQWLDLARYADTHGYHIDSAREMWHWRDWLIDAFNRNLPYSEFTIEQLAGDLLPNATTAQKVASGFNRNHMINFEGGAIPEEYQNEYVVDRVETTSITWLGLTMGCARCHDHKYDPIKQKEFYQFYAFFNNVAEKGLDGQRGNAKPYLELPSPDQASKLDSLTQSIDQHEKALPESELNALQTKWEAARLATLPQGTREGLLAHYEFDGNIADSSGHYRYGRLRKGDLTYDDGAVGKAGEFDGETDLDLGQVSAIDSASPFSLSLWVKINGGFGGHQRGDLITRLSDPKTRQGFEIYFDDFVLTDIQEYSPRLFVRFSSSAPDNAIEIGSREHLIQNDWYQITLNYDGSGKASGLRLYLNGKPADAEILKDSLTGPTANNAALEIGDKALGVPFKGKLDDLRIYNRQLSAAEIDPLVTNEPIRALLMMLPESRSKDQAARLRDYYLSREAPPQYQKAYIELKALREQKDALVKTIPTTMVMSELEKPRETVILGRGDYRNRGEKVTPGVPAILPPLPKGAPLSRLTLAKWLVEPSNPLTARVAVNRYWQMYFGTGIVKTAENFGSQGEAPSHPELLDWLATEFVGTGWDIRAMQRLIVTSATYRQSSASIPEMIERDPENRLLARGPRFRLPAEMIRDNALFASGLLRERVGGPSVFPSQPKGLWEDIAFGDGFSAQTYTPSHGADLYRRAMYTFWKRTSPPPDLITFDAPDREKCTARRLPTNTPLQALVLLNDPVYIEAAHALALRMIAEGGKNPVKRIDYGFRLATARKPTSKEERILRGLAARELHEYKRNPADAQKLLAAGESKSATPAKPAELAAWTTVASTILNLDETITKE